MKIMAEIRLINVPLDANKWILNIRTPQNSYYPPAESVLWGIPVDSSYTFTDQFDRPYDVPAGSVFEVHLLNNMATVEKFDAQIPGDIDGVFTIDCGESDNAVQFPASVNPIAAGAIVAILVILMIKRRNKKRMK